MAESATDWSLRTWKDRHDRGYFPNSEQHKDWRIYDAPPPWLMEYGKPTGDDVVLEVGCGYGQWMIPLAKHVRTVNGIDIHQSLADVAAGAFIVRDVKNCRVTVNNGTAIPFDDHSFSLVYSISVFQHLPRAIVAGYLKESARVLAAGGRCLHHFRNANNVGPFPPLAKDIEANHTGDFSCGWTPEQIASAASQHFTHVEVKDIGLFLILIASN